MATTWSHAAEPESWSVPLDVAYALDELLKTDALSIDIDMHIILSYVHDDDYVYGMRCTVYKSKATIHGHHKTIRHHRNKVYQHNHQHQQRDESRNKPKAGDIMLICRSMSSSSFISQSDGLRVVMIVPCSYTFPCVLCVFYTIDNSYKTKNVLIIFCRVRKYGCLWFQCNYTRRIVLKNIAHTGSHWIFFYELIDFVQEKVILGARWFKRMQWRGMAERLSIFEDMRTGHADRIDSKGALRHAEYDEGWRG